VATHVYGFEVLWGGKNKGMAKYNIEPLPKKTTVASDAINVRELLAADAGVSEQNVRKYLQIRQATPLVIWMACLLILMYADS